MRPDEIEAAARIIFEAEKSGVPVEILSERFPQMSMQNSYAIQHKLMELKQAEGHSIIGWKIGKVSKTVQRAFHHEIPVTGFLCSGRLFQTGATIPLDMFFQPNIQAEIAFVLKSPLRGAVTARQVLEATEYVRPAVEIGDCRYIKPTDPGMWEKTHEDIVADNATGGGVVLSDDRHDPNGLDLRWVGVIAKHDGIVSDTGLGAAVLNDPVAAIQWLSERLDFMGLSIAAGQIILTGSLVTPMMVKKGSRFNLDYGSFGAIDLNFE